MTIRIKATIPAEIEWSDPFPWYRVKFEGEHGIGDYKTEYWKFESHHKVTRITERMCETSLLTLDDPNADFVYDLMEEDMLMGLGAYDACTEKKFDQAAQRLIDKVVAS